MGASKKLFADVFETLNLINKLAVVALKKSNVG